MFAGDACVHTGIQLAATTKDYASESLQVPRDERIIAGAVAVTRRRNGIELFFVLPEKAKPKQTETGHRRGLACLHDARGPPGRATGLSWWVLFGGSDGSSRPVVRPVRRPILSTAAPAVNRQPRRPSSHRQAHRRRRALHCITGWTGHSLRTHNPALDGGGSPPRAVSRDPAWIPAVSVRLMIRMDPQPAGTFRFNEHVQVSMLTRATTPS